MGGQPYETPWTAMFEWRTMSLTSAMRLLDGGIPPLPRPLAQYSSMTAKVDGKLIQQSLLGQATHPIVTLVKAMLHDPVRAVASVSEVKATATVVKCRGTTLC